MVYQNIIFSFNTLNLTLVLVYTLSIRLFSKYWIIYVVILCTHPLVCHQIKNLQRTLIPWTPTAYRNVILLFVTDTMQSPVNIILVACVCVVVSMAMPCWSDPLPASAEIASRPTRPKVFTSPDQLKGYLEELVNYYAIEGRPRCVRIEIILRANLKDFDADILCFDWPVFGKLF